jgi:hypothetical protein
MMSFSQHLSFSPSLQCLPSHVFWFILIFHNVSHWLSFTPSSHVSLTNISLLLTPFLTFSADSHRLIFLFS